ncbi:DUF1330 domain-containing protein [Aliiroseovarius halocynthiae]|uniref:DUF1330 domain-containing protein n=2 Tax=Aliiroseovarius halocynthiae TaxID=985055 RepID=A0A545SMV3_9RHOB|nr:DUF1330 domain-containing protein [Aliiroseovarius halocynthiae]
MADPAYFIAQIQVDDWDRFIGEYGSVALPTLMEHNAKILVGGPGATVLEGQWAGNHTVVLEFENREALDTWYASPEYQAARPFRDATTSLNNIVATEAFVMPE